MYQNPRKRKFAWDVANAADKRRKVAGPLYKRGGTFGAAQRRGYGSVPRTRGGAVSGEMKYFDVENAITAIAATTTTWVAGTMNDPTTTIALGDPAIATPLCLFVPKVSAALNGRIGRQVKVLKIRANFVITIAPQAAQTVADASNCIKIMLVQDCQTNSAQMTGAQLMNDAAGATSTLMSFQNPNNFGRFKVLKTKTLAISDLNIAGSPTAGDVLQVGKTVQFKMSVKFKEPVVVHFNATNGGTVADIIDHSFHILAATNSTAYAPTLVYYCRTAYKE